MDLHRRLPLPHLTRRLSHHPRRFAFSLALALAALLLLPALFAQIAPALTDAAAFVPAPLDRALTQMGWRDDAYAFLADLGFYPPGSACAGGGCQAWYCDLVINGQCHERSGSGYVPSNPVGCLGNCGGGAGSCSSGRCANGDPYRCGCISTWGQGMGR